MWLPDNRKALNGLWELSIIVPIAAWRTEREFETKWVVYIRSDLYPDGEFVPELEARLSVFGRVIRSAIACTNTDALYRHSPIQFEEHMDRMFTSLKTLRINPGVTHEEFCALCQRCNDERFMD